jgi:hypothetical protein
MALSNDHHDTGGRVPPDGASGDRRTRWPAFRSRREGVEQAEVCVLSARRLVTNW